MGPEYLGKLLYWRSLLMDKVGDLLGRQSHSVQQEESADTNSSQSNGSSSRWTYKYDVFLSFRGTDTRSTFVDHLYAHLIRKGIFTFKDDQKLKKGKSISPQLLQAIQESRVSIIVFSKDYASSTWCLDEMAAITKCQKDFKQNVFPVFYDVDPSDVRRQSGVYQNAFALHTKKFILVPGKVDEWKTAMRGLASLSGWDVRDKPEFGEIDKIVQEVVKALGHKFSGFAEDLIGVQPRVESLEKRLTLRSQNIDVLVLGIWGMGGIGKTTYATVLYDRISYQFEASCFIEDVSKIYRDGGAIALQKQIIHQTFDEIGLERYSPPEISRIVKNRFHNIKVLIVLDNVDQLEHLQELAIDPKSLHEGSRMIITTRDKHILEVYGADEIHEVPLLNHHDAFELFDRKAFKSDCSSSSNRKLIPKVLNYAQGLPLAIRVVGSFLCTRDATQWRATLDGLRNNPTKKIMDVLQISFEGLESREREIFLHIACFFNGERVDYVKRILACCRLNPDIGIPIIIEKSLVAIRNQEIHMHEMLQELGRKIIQEQFPEEPGEWSRLWLYQHFHHVMITDTGTKNVKAIVINQKEDVLEYSRLKVEGLSIMKELRLLILYNNNFSGSPNFIPNSLQYLLWHGYPFAYLPQNFEPYSLVEMNMPYSSIHCLWEGCKCLPYLKRMDLSNSKYLVETPDFKNIRSLEWLDFTGCTNLSKVHPSIGHLEKLAFLSLEGCSNLVSLYLDSESNLCSLRVLHLSGCTKLEATPDFTGLTYLEYLDIDQCTSLTTVHMSLGHLSELKFLSLRHCINLASMPNRFETMTSLRTLDVYGCSKLSNVPLLRQASVTMREEIAFYFDDALKNSYHQSLVFLDLGFCNIREVPDGIYELKCLERLNLEGNNIVSLLSSIQSLSSLAYLNLSQCHELQFWFALPSMSSSSGGRYFEMVSGSRNHRSGLYAIDCPMLSGQEIHCHNLALSWLVRLVQQPCHFRCGFDIVIPGHSIPEWFNRQFEPDSVIEVNDSYMSHNWIGFAFCVSFDVNLSRINYDHCEGQFYPHHPIYLSFESEYVEERFDMALDFDMLKLDGSEHVWLIYISQPHCHFVKNGALIRFKACPGLVIRNWGLRLVFMSDIIEKERQLRWGQQNESVEEAGESEGQQNESAEEASETEGEDYISYHFACEISSSNMMSEPKVGLPYNCFSQREPKFQFPYNWLTTNEEESENLAAKEKETSFADMGL